MSISLDAAQSHGKNMEKVSAFRRILPQVLAASAKNVHQMDYGLIIAMPSIIIPALTGIKNEHNIDEFLSITASQSSWISSFRDLFQPLGSFVSGFFTDRIGRKLSMIVINIPFAIGYYWLFQATEVWHIFFGFGMLGFGAGLMRAPMAVYIGEICEPSTRGILNAISSCLTTMGGFMLFTLNGLVSWRTAAMICMMMPIISTCLLSFVPETPQWLLSRNRVNEAEKSLRWLRGWVPSSTVTHEFTNLQRHSERAKSCNSCIEQDRQCSHPPPTLLEKVAELKQRRTFKPFAMVIMMFFLAQFNGVYAMRPYIVQIFKAYGSPIESDLSATIVSLMDNFGVLTFICLIRFIGKRRIFLSAGTGIFFTSLTISCYGFIMLPRGYTSFDKSNQFPHLESISLVPIICLYLWSYFSYAGYNAMVYIIYNQMPWILLSELFNFKSRVIVSSCAGVINYLFSFINKKIYYDLETTLSMPGVSLLYSVICGTGLIVMYLILPETEGRSLEDIELHFSDDSKKITDRQIAISQRNVDPEI